MIVKTMRAMKIVIDQSVRDSLNWSLSRFDEISHGASELGVPGPRHSYTNEAAAYTSSVQSTCYDFSTKSA